MGEKYFNMLTLWVLLLCYSKKISSADHSALKFRLQFEIKDFFPPSNILIKIFYVDDTLIKIDPKVGWDCFFSSNDVYYLHIKKLLLIILHIVSTVKIEKKNKINVQCVNPTAFECFSPMKILIKRHWKYSFNKTFAFSKSKGA